MVNGSYPATWCTNCVVHNTNCLKTRPTGTQYLAGALTRGMNNPGLVGPVDENLQVNLISGDSTTYWGGGFLTSTPGVDSIDGSAHVPSTSVPTAASVLLYPSPQ